MTDSEMAPADVANVGSLAGLKCIVCDKTATMTCDQCLNVGHIAIPLCSKEHLELIQPAHKLVCGKNAHPFAIPFQQEEANQIYELVNNEDALGSMSDWNQALYWAIRTNCEAKFPGDLKAGLNGLVGVLPTMRGDPYRPVSSDNAKTAGSLREWYTHLIADKMAEDPTGVTVLPGFNLAYNTFTSGAPDTRFDDQWHSLFCHRLIAHVPLINLAVKPTTPQNQRVEAKQLADASLQGLRRFVAETDKDAYKGFRDAVLKSMSKNL